MTKREFSTEFAQKLTKELDYEIKPKDAQKIIDVYHDYVRSLLLDGEEVRMDQMGKLLVSSYKRGYSDKDGTFKYVKKYRVFFKTFNTFREYLNKPGIIE